MHRKKLPLSVVAAAMSACALEPELLNSERIEGRFGSYGIEVLSSQSGLRRSNLYSTDNGIRTCRTYAVVRFTGESSALVDTEHEQILAGNSIGAIFKANGWSIHKESLYVGTMRLEKGAGRIADLMRVDIDTEVAMHIYRLLLEKDGQALEYATIMELHHPEYLVKSDLDEMYEPGSDRPLEPQQIEEFITLGLDAT
jgi:hypothetical protein